LNLHGAGLEADSQQVSHMLDAVPDLDAWVLFPTGMSPWSGDDWHVWGYADVNAAVSAIPEWIQNMHWRGPAVDTERWIVTGHSNGGQGSWFISSHQPDKVIATAAVSGYSSIQSYIPYTLWREASPLIDSIIQNSLSSYRHERLVGNLTGTSIYQQHGAKDDNVPACHSRLMRSLLYESGSSPQYVELPDRGHWFEGAMTTRSLRAFYSSVLGSEASTRRVPKAFEFVIPNSGDIGSRAGIFVDQLQSPDICGRLHVHCDEKAQIWHIKTSNIHRMHVAYHASGIQQPTAMSLDGTLIHIAPGSDQDCAIPLVRCDDRWVVCDNHIWKVLSARFGRQRGCLDAILRTSSCLKIQICSDKAFEAALQVSRNLIQYYGADSEITTIGEDSDISATGNSITLHLGKAVKPARLGNFPIQIGADGIQIRRLHTTGIRRIPHEPGLGAALLRPLPDENLELVLWGYDEVGLQQAVRMVPTLTGTGQPDFVVLGDDARWKGHGGALAMGFLDHAWQISQASYIP
jgi:predicted esterase